MSRFIALLRGINVGGKNKIPMAKLCALCRDLGWVHVQSYIQSGNVVFTADGKSDAHEAALEQSLERELKVSVPVIVRSARQWREYAKGNPFPDASMNEPNRVMLAVPKSRPKRDAENALRGRAANGEQIEQVGPVLWIHFPAGQAKTKLSPTLMDRFVGSSVTTRNWSTVTTIRELLSA